ncbi:hypothetical protein HZU40_34000 (plasmid) [Mycolicibacterium fluoranthenivorans]|uniref:Uncharacterized protein n=1 Tax=Mycolicibacterium fluoranthenivorans TaxID=258505 RepID=A0A7G8PQC9_9MYCO|nr:hypothetical protein [Mycolicibacterium fluoranthenivorans]QNJ96545.1 hypothetical protein HZU40_34000 [Mycolicibacterium fluoranthenivorans]
MTAQPKPDPKATDSSADPISEAVQKAGGLIVSAVKQGQGLSLDAARKAADANSSLMAGLRLDSSADKLPDIAALTTYSFDLAIELLTAQRDFAAELASVITPAKPE